MNIALVGGGNAALTILNYFSFFKKHTVIGITDINENAIGMIKARELGIKTYTNIEELIKRIDVEIIIELTGNDKVSEQLRKIQRSDQSVISSKCARIMSDLIDAQTEMNSSIAKNISSKFNELVGKLENTLKIIDGSFKAINHLLKEGNIISINAKIKAARAGEAGKPFGVVVNRINLMVKEIKEAAGNIGIASKETSLTIKDIVLTAKNLDETFMNINEKAGSIK